MRFNSWSIEYVVVIAGKSYHKFRMVLSNTHFEEFQDYVPQRTRTWRKDILKGNIDYAFTKYFGCRQWIVSDEEGRKFSTMIVLIRIHN